MTSLAPYNCNFVSGQSFKVPERSHEKPNFRAAIEPEAALEEDLDVLEDEVASLLHLEGEGVAVEPREPDNDVEALGEVLDRARGRKQHLPSTTKTLFFKFISFQTISAKFSHVEHVGTGHRTSSNILH